MKKTITTLLLTLVCMAAWCGSEVNRPRLIVGIVVDQMRWDYLYYYYDQYDDGGLKRLLNNGFSCENTMIPYVPTVTAIGHSCVYTGSVPAFSGIAGNNFLLNGVNVTSVTDNTVHAVGSSPENSDGFCSPRNLLANTIGDQLKLATNFKSKVIGVALKDRAAILPAGHSADAAYWWDTKAGHFITSSYYMDKLPRWVENFNRNNNTESGFDIKTSNKGVTMTFKMAEEALKNEHLGKHETTDMLAVSISSTDAIGHTYSTRGKENREVYMQLDKDLAHFLRVLDREIGSSNYLLFLTADHGAVHNGNFLNEHKMPGGGFSSRPAKEKVNNALAQHFGVEGNYIKEVMDCRLYLDREFIAAHNLDFTQVKKKVVETLREDPQFAYVLDYEDVQNSTVPQFLRERIINGYHRLRSGDIMVVLQGSHMHGTVGPTYKGTSHGTWNPDDSHIPLIFMGWNVKEGSTSTPTFMTDIAPTVCAMLHIQMPDCCIGNAIQEVWK
ncbi:MAG: alkaline phosphatase family protein [Prevotella sp.]|nr:alkaline phosphatase family protein [Prevotella sp.]